MSTTDENPFISDPIPRVKNGVAFMPPEDEKLRLFFLEEARILCPLTQTDCSEYSKLHALYKRLKRMDRLFTLMYSHDWGELLQTCNEHSVFIYWKDMSLKKTGQELSTSWPKKLHLPPKWHNSMTLSRT